ncbi:MAG: hypothetical protein AAF514_00985 [Verrucomicrobiota bacterium]
MARFFSCCAIWFLCLVAGYGQDTTSSPDWTAADTRTANQLLQRLHQKPERGKILDGLWDLYQKHDQGGLLLETYRARSQPGADDREVFRRASSLIYGLLLQKNGELETAGAVLEDLLGSQPGNIGALKAHVRVSRELGRPEAERESLEALLDIDSLEQVEKAGILLEKGLLLFSLEDREGAGLAWIASASLMKLDDSRRSDLVRACLGAGLLDEAYRILKPLTESGEPANQINALFELSRIEELSNDFEAAANTLTAAMKRADFRHPLHEKAWVRLVLLHERFDQLPRLEASLGSDRSEAGLWRKGLFLRELSLPERRETVLRELAERFPSPGYERALVDLLRENQRFDEALARMDTSGEYGSTGLESRLDACSLLFQAGRKEEAEVRAMALLEMEDFRTPESEARLLAFARTFFLDGVEEQILRERATRSGRGAPMLDWAKFLLGRNRFEEGEGFLEAYVKNGDPDRLVERRREAVELLRAVGQLARAGETMSETLAGGKGLRQDHLGMAEVFAEQRRIGEALEQFGEAWNQSADEAERFDVDERLYAVLKQEADPAADVNDESEEISGPNSGPVRQDLLTVFYDQVFEAGSADGALPAERVRAGWWAFRLGDVSEAHDVLGAWKKAGEAISVPGLSLFVEVCRAMKNGGLAVRLLDELSALDPDGNLKYSDEKARILFSRGAFERVVQLLSPMVRTAPEAARIELLARAHEGQGDRGTARRLLLEAFRKSVGRDQQHLLKAASRLLHESGDIDEALRLGFEFLSAERDPARRWVSFEGQLGDAVARKQLRPLLEVYEKACRQRPFDGFLHRCLAEIHRADGRPGKAFTVLWQAWHYDGGWGSDVLRDLRDLAAETGQNDEAVALQRRLLRLPEERHDIEVWKKLIELLESGFQWSEAESVRRRLPVHFGRRPEVLEVLAREAEAADRWTRAAELRGQLVDLKPWDPVLLYREAIALSRAGNLDEADRGFARLVDETAPTSVEHEPIIHWFDEPFPSHDPYGMGLLEKIQLPDRKWLDDVAGGFRLLQSRFSAGSPSVAVMRLASIRHLASRGKTLAIQGLTPCELRWLAFYARDRAAFENALSARDSKAQTPVEQFFLSALCLEMGSHGWLVQRLEEGLLDPALFWAVVTWMQTHLGFSLEADELKRFIAVARAARPQWLAMGNNLARLGRGNEGLVYGEALWSDMKGAGPRSTLALLMSRWAWPQDEATSAEWLEKALSASVDHLPREGFEEVRWFSELAQPDRHLAVQERALRQLSGLPESRQPTLLLAALSANLGAVEAMNGWLDRSMKRLGSPGRVENQRGLGVEDLLPLTGHLRRVGLKMEAMILLERCLVRPELDEALVSRWTDQRLIWNLAGQGAVSKRREMEKVLTRSWDIERFSNLAERLSRFGFVEEARQVYHHLVREKPADRAYYLRFLEMSGESGRIGPAVAWLEEILQKVRPVPKGRALPEIHQDLARLLRKTGALEALRERAGVKIPVLQRLQLENPYLRHLAELAGEEDRLEEASKRWDEILALRAQRPVNLLDRGPGRLVRWKEEDDLAVVLAAGENLERRGLHEEAEQLYRACVIEAAAVEVAARLRERLVTCTLKNGDPDWSAMMKSALQQNHTGLILRVGRAMEKAGTSGIPGFYRQAAAQAEDSQGRFHRLLAGLKAGPTSSGNGWLEPLFHLARKDPSLVPVLAEALGGLDEGQRPDIEARLKAQLAVPGMTRLVFPLRARLVDQGSVGELIDAWKVFVADHPQTPDHQIAFVSQLSAAGHWGEARAQYEAALLNQRRQDWVWRVSAAMEEGDGAADQLVPVLQTIRRPDWWPVLEVLEAGGRRDLALRLGRDWVEKMERTGPVSNRFERVATEGFLAGFARILVDQRSFGHAEKTLGWLAATDPVAASTALAELYRAWYPDDWERAEKGLRVHQLGPFLEERVARLWRR